MGPLRKRTVKHAKNGLGYGTLPYDFNVVREDRARDEFFYMLREQLGLALTPEQRDISMLVVHSM